MMTERRSRRPRWSLATSFWFCVAATAIVVPLTTIVLRGSIWVELELVTAVLSALMLIYFTVILHQGVRFQEGRRASIAWPRRGPAVLKDVARWAPTSGLNVELDAGCLGIFVVFIVDAIVMAVLVLLVVVLPWIGIHLVGAVVLFLFWAHTRWLRYLVTTGRHCRGSWGRSLLHGAATTLRFTAWFYAAFFAAHVVSEMLA